MPDMKPTETVDAELAAPALADDPPATPAAPPASPAQGALAATPTGLGLSCLSPLSPPSALAPLAKTPAATPVAGLPVDSGVAHDALQAAVQALGGSTAELPISSPAPSHIPANGFGSPMREAADSPCEASVSIGVAIGAAADTRSAATEDGEVDSHSPAIIYFAPTVASASPPAAAPAGAEEEADLARMLRTPSFSPEQQGQSRQGGSAPANAPVLAASTASAVAQEAAKAPTPVVVKVALASAHPFTPSRQVVLEEEQVSERGWMIADADTKLCATTLSSLDIPCAAPLLSLHQDYVMEVSDAAAALSDAANAADAPLPALAASAPLLKSMVVASPGSFDPRSLRQLKKEVAAKMEAKHATSASPGSAAAEAASETANANSKPARAPMAYDISADASSGAAAAAALTTAMGGLSLGGSGCGINGPLRGLPTPIGTHIR